MVSGLKDLAQVAASAWIQSLARELPYAVGTAIKKKKKKKKKNWSHQSVTIKAIPVDNN